MTDYCGKLLSELICDECMDCDILYKCSQGQLKLRSEWVDDEVPTVISDDDPNQGWGDEEDEEE